MFKRVRVRFRSKENRSDPQIHKLSNYWILILYIQYGFMIWHNKVIKKWIQFMIRLDL